MTKRKLHTYLRGWLIPILGLLFFGLALRGADALWAAPQSAPQNQTVPPPTYTPENTPVPTATPAASDDSDDDSDDEPTPTPTDDDFIGDEGDGGDESEGDGSESENSDGAGADDAGGEESSSDAAGGNSGGTTETEEPSNSESGTASPTETGSETGSESGSESVTSNVIAKVKAIVLNVRSGPGGEFPVIGTVFQDDALQVLGRSGNWWQICCSLGTSEPGWVDAQFLEPDFDIASLDELIPDVSGANNQPASRNTGSSASAANDSTLQFELSLEPMFVWPGHPFAMTFTVTNTSSSAANDVRIRNDFSNEIVVLVVMDTDDKEDVDTADEINLSESPSGTTIMVADWAEIESGESRSFSVMLEIHDEAELGDVINNLAVVTAANADDVTAGISIGMPPARLPSFR